MTFLDLTGPRFVSIIAQAGLLTGGIGLCLLFGIYIHVQGEIDASGHLCSYEGIGNVDVAIAGIVLSAFGAVVQMCCLPITLFKKEDMVKVQVVMTVAGIAGVGLGCLMAGVLIAIMING